VNLSTVFCNVLLISFYRVKYSPYMIAVPNIRSARLTLRSVFFDFALLLAVASDSPMQPT
jgi:hypothetical protein